MGISTGRFFRKLDELVGAVGSDVAYYDPRIQNAIINRVQAYKKFFSLSPFSNQYYCPFNPVFTCEIRLLEDGGGYPVYLVRDGRIDLIDFFMDHPRPDAFGKSLFLFHVGLADIVPKAWIGRSCFFELRSKARRVPKRRKLVLVGIFNGLSFGRDYLKGIGRKISPFVEGGGEVWLCPLFRNNEYFSAAEGSVNPTLDLSSSIRSLFGHRVVLMSENEIMRLSGLRDYYYHFLFEDDLLCSDNYLEHYFLSCGARPFVDRRLIPEGEYVFDLSAYHRIVMTKKRSKPLVAFKDIARNIRLYASLGYDPPFCGQFFLWYRRSCAQMAYSRGIR